MDRKDLKPKERSLIDDLKDAWIGSETFSELSQATTRLARLVSADCMTLCVSRPSPSDGYIWMPSDMPVEFFNRGSEWEQDDFLRKGVVLHPGTVMRDTDLISPEALKRNAMYRISRELGMPLSHAVSVLLQFPGLPGHGGFTAYRSRSPPFTERDQQLVQHVARLLALALQKCRKLMDGDLHTRLFGSVVQDKQIALLVLEPPDIVVERTDSVSKLVSRWFQPSECTKTGVPKELLVKLASLMGSMETAVWRRTRAEESLKVVFSPMPCLDGLARWQLSFEEEWQSPLDKCTEKLTRAEKQVLELLKQGLSNKEIAKQRARATDTVKQQVESIFEKTGIHDRKKLIIDARGRPPEKP